MDASLDTNVIIHLYSAELQDNYTKICSLSGLTMDCDSKLNAFLRRFWSKPFSNAEKVWMNDFCSTRAINAKEKIMALHLFLLQNSFYS